MKEKAYRHGMVAAQIEIDIPLQIRALRKSREMTQPKLAELTGMRQPRISAMEKPGGAHFTLETLKRVAEAFDVALIVQFAPFSELMGWSDKFNPDDFAVPSFEEEVNNTKSFTAMREKERIDKILKLVSCSPKGNTCRASIVSNTAIAIGGQLGECARKPLGVASVGGRVASVFDQFAALPSAAESR